MIYIILALGGLLLALRATLPKKRAVYAARADRECDVPPSQTWTGGAFAQDRDGVPIEVEGKFVGVVDGDSMAAYGLERGATFVAEPLDDNARAALSTGDVIVVDAPAIGGTHGLRLRAVDAVDIAHGKVSFAPDGKGKSHHARPFSEVVAKVQYVQVGGR